MEFKALGIDDKQKVDSYIKRFPPQISELTFTNLFAWRNSKEASISEFDRHLVIKTTDYCLQPVGPEPHEIISRLAKDGLVFERVEEAVAKQVSGCVAEHTPEHDDYVYSVEEMRELKGDRFTPKRNFINRIERLNPDVCVLSRSQLHDFLNLQDRWCAMRTCELTRELQDENEAIRETLINCEKLDVFGICVRLQGELVAFAIGEPLNEDTFVEHFEKADTSNAGVYQYILNQFSRNMPEGFKFLNREQDLGIPGLRKAKQSYYPVKKIRKYRLHV